MNIEARFYTRYYKYIVLAILIILIILHEGIIAQEIKGRIISDIHDSPLTGIDLNLDDDSGISVSNVIPLEIRSAQVPVRDTNFILDSDGSIEGHILDPNGNPIPNIDIDILDLAGNTISTVDANTNEEGFYSIGLLPPGGYFVKADPDYESGQMYFDQYYTNALSIETAVPVIILPTSPGIISGIDFILKPIVGFSVIEMDFSNGLNLFGYPVKVSQIYTSFDLIQYLGTKDEIKRIQRYDPLKRNYEATMYNYHGIIIGKNFQILNGEGYLLYTKKGISASFSGNISNSELSLKKGFNIAHLLHIPQEYTSFDLISHIGSPDEIDSIIRFDTETGLFEATYYHYGRPFGRRFEISVKESYFIYMKVDKTLSLPQ